MNRLFFTGDTHRDYDYGKVFLFNRQMKNEGLDKNDIMVVMGDWGGVWYGNTKDDRFIREKWDSLPWTTFCVLGNHENYRAYETLYPTVEFCGAAALKISNSVYVAISGEVYDLNGKTCLCINGADSHDIYFANGTPYRKEGRDWWREEQISEDAVTNALNNLSIYKEVDFVLSHTGGSEVCYSLGLKPTISDLRFDKVLEAAKYKTRYCGHYHKDMWINDKTRILYNDIIEIN